MVALAAALSLTVSAEPPLLRLGQDARATVRIQSRSEPRLAASAGRIENLRRAGEAAFEADFLPPDDGLPQVAIVSAVSADGAGFAPIPLWGQGDALVKTRRGAAITVQIGAQTFGPVIADGQGEALVPVTVPPGVQTARHGKRAIELHVPPARAVQLATGRAQVLADRAEELELFAFAVTATGEARTGAVLVARVSRGALGAFEPRGPGLYAARWTLPQGQPGTALATAALADAPGLEATATLEIVAGPARAIELTADRASLVAGDPGARLHAVARDAAGNPAREQLRFAASFGAVRASPSGPGEWTIELTLPAALEEHRSLEVTASGALASAAAEIALAPAAPARAAFAGGALAMHADGKSALLLPLEVRDRFGNRIAEARPVVSAERGSAAIAPRSGSFVATYVPPLSRERTSAVVTIRAGDALASAHVDLLPQVALLALSPKAGALSNFSGLTSPLVGVEAALRWDRVAVGLEAAYAFFSRNELVTAAGGTPVANTRGGSAAAVSARSRTDYALLWAPVSLRLPLGDRSVAWVSAGPTLTAVWTRSGADGALGPTSSALAPGGQFAVGAERRFRLAVPFLELRCGLTRDPRLAALPGTLRSFSFAAGVRLELL